VPCLPLVLDHTLEHDGRDEARRDGPPDDPMGQTLHRQDLVTCPNGYVRYSVYLRSDVAQLIMGAFQTLEVYLKLAPSLEQGKRQK